MSKKFSFFFFLIKSAKWNCPRIGKSSRRFSTKCPRPLVFTTTRALTPSWIFFPIWTKSFKWTFDQYNSMLLFIFDINTIILFKFFSNIQGGHYTLEQKWKGTLWHARRANDSFQFELPTREDSWWTIWIRSWSVSSFENTLSLWINFFYRCY